MLKRALRKVRRTITGSKLYQRLFVRQKARDELHQFWRSPTDGNQPEQYIAEDERLLKRSELLVELVRNQAGTEGRILEVGCNAGRNLKHLHDNGYGNLEAIEISENAVALFRERFPEVTSTTQLHVRPIEEVIRDFPESCFDLVFTMAVLEHIHTDSEWIFQELVRITRKVLITIEDEEGVSWRHFPRNYRQIFERLGLVQVHEIQCVESKHGLGSQFRARVFQKPV